MGADVKIWFGNRDIKFVEIPMPCMPRSGDNIVFPHGLLQFYNGGQVPQNTFKVLAVDFIISEALEARVEVNVQAIY